MRWYGVAIAIGVLCAAVRVDADAVMRVTFTPTSRAQIAIWLETADGEFVETLKLTHATALRGIGNRPGALQMNSGFRWPYGRRESVLPVWAHRRATAEPLFPRVIFQNRWSEGNASRDTSDYSYDDYFCLSFDTGLSKQEALDAVSCASIFSSDKGRYITQDDVDRGYAEPFEIAPGVETLRPLSLYSLYPPRRDLLAAEIYDHPDVLLYAEDARAAMPSIDAVSMATPAGDTPFAFQWFIPEELPQGDYVLYVEVHTEGDHNVFYSPKTLPTPGTSRSVPSIHWDFWARVYGYPYRGQPSVVYAVPITLDGRHAQNSVRRPVGHSVLHGLVGEIVPMNPTINDDPEDHPGSGADRLRASPRGDRLHVELEFFEPEQCQGALPFADEIFGAPYEDERHSHRFATVGFTPREGSVPVFDWEVVVSREPILDEEDFERATAANRAELDTVSLALCEIDEETRARACPEPDVPLVFDIGQLQFLTTYHVGIRAQDYCGRKGPIATTQVTTTAIHYTTVSPCFVATAAYGSPLAEEIDVLRRFRDEILLTNALGRAFVDVYYEHGPALAAWIAEDEDRRSAARALLSPIVALLEAIYED